MLSLFKRIIYENILFKSLLGYHFFWGNSFLFSRHSSNLYSQNLINQNDLCMVFGLCYYHDSDLNYTPFKIKYKFHI